MSFLIRNLSVLAYANGFTHWHYKTNDQFSDLFQSGYFSDCVDMIAAGDVVTISAANGCGIRSFDEYGNLCQLL